MTLTFDLPDGLAERLEQAAAQHGMPLTDYVRPALEALATPRLAAPLVSTADEWAAHVARVRAAAGSMAHLGGSVDEFLTEKHAENEREEAKSRDRGAA